MQKRVVTITLMIGLCFAVPILVSGMSGWRLPDNQQGYAPQQPIAYSHRLHAGELGIDCRFCHWAAGESQHAGIPSQGVCMKCHRVVTAPFGVLQEKTRLEDEIKLLTEEQTSTSEADPSDEPKPTIDELKASAEKLEIPSPQLKRLYESLGLEVLSPGEEPTDLKKIDSPEMRELFASLNLKDQFKPIKGATPQSIPWVRVHNLPDYVTFNHEAHVTAGVTCQLCHGPVVSMERVRQFASLSMGWCVNCHRDATENGINGQAVHASTDCTVCHH